MMMSNTKISLKIYRNRRSLTQNGNNQTATKLIINRINNNNNRKKQQKQYWSRRWRWSKIINGVPKRKWKKLKHIDVVLNGPHTLIRRVLEQINENRITPIRNWLQAKPKTYQVLNACLIPKRSAWNFPHFNISNSKMHLKSTWHTHTHTN